MKRKLMEPIMIGNVEIPNRLVYLAQGKSLSDGNGHVTPRQLGFYEGLARGGVGLIIPGCLVIDKDWPSILKGETYAYSDEYIPDLKQMVDVVHKHGAKLFYQPWHPGMVDYVGNGVPSIAELTKEEIHQKQELFVEASVRCQKAGADGLEFQICHNYLACDFFTPAFNGRTDEYSAETMENRLRFALETIAKIQDACGKKYPIIVKLQAYDGNMEGGITPEMAAEAAPYLERAGVAMISVTAGGKLSGVPLMSADGNRSEGWKTEFAEIVKKAVHIPVCDTGSLRHWQFCEEVIASGKADMIGMARGLVAEPDWMKKMSEGKEDEQRNCVSCMHCMTAFHGPERSNCTVNPLALRETLHMDELSRDGNGRKVVIIGAGPAGMEAAVTLAKRGFAVTIFEVEDTLGGMARLAAVPAGKYKLNWMIEYYEHMMQKYGVDVRTGTKATPELIRAENPYAVCIATGSVPLCIPIQGKETNDVREVREVLRHISEISGKNIVIIGAGLTGLETARTLAEQGNQVLVMDMLETIAGGIEYGLAQGYAMAAGVKICMSYRLTEITEAGVRAQNLKIEENVEFPADMVILSVGVRPEEQLYEAVKDDFAHVTRIGDCAGKTTILEGVQDGYDYAYHLE